MEKDMTEAEAIEEMEKLFESLMKMILRLVIHRLMIFFADS
jgi:hypothetical protein